MYELVEDHWQEYEVSNTKLVFKKTHVEATVENLLPTRVIRFLDRLQLEETRASVLTNTLPVVRSFKEFLLEQPAWKRELIQERSFGKGVTSFVDVLAQHDEVGGLWIVSDGSVKGHQMTYGWVIANPKTGEVLAEGKGPGWGLGSSL